MVQRMEAVEKHLEKGELAEGRQILEEARALALRDGLGHGVISWRLAVVCDWMGDLEEAMGHVNEALQQEPLAPAHHRSFDIISNRIRRALTDPDRDPADPSTPRLYTLLVQHDEANTESHLAMARWHLQREEAQAAYTLLSALTVLAPTFGPGWAALAEAARQLGREDEASAHELEARMCNTGKAPPFSMPAARA